MAFRLNRLIVPKLLAITLPTLWLVLGCASTNPEPAANSKQLPTPLGPVDLQPTSEFLPVAGAVPKGSVPDGTLTLPQPSLARLELLKDSFEIAAKPEFQLNRLPQFEISWVADDGWLIPTIRTPQNFAHPYWQWISAPGRQWVDPAQADRVQLSLPFTLKEGNQNCVHYGLMRLSLDPAGGLAQMNWQVASETCAYLKFNASGSEQVLFQPGDVANAGEIKIRWRAERDHRLEVKDLAAFSALTASVNLEALKPPFPDDTTVYGLVADGIHYRSDCPTRAGPHPYCTEIPLPSYSTAKSLFAGLVWMRMLKLWPELELAEVTTWLPECRLADQRWSGVKLHHLADMTTGLYDSTGFETDESASKMQTFFLSTSNRERIEFSCSAWPQQAEPGTRGVYHTTDHYLLGVALQRFLRARSGPDHDIHRDILVHDILSSVSPSPLMTYSDRSFDEDRQPFVGYGLLYLADDVARIGATMQQDKTWEALFRPQDMARIRFESAQSAPLWQMSRGEAYEMGFWGFDIAPFMACEAPTWIPFMSGYGGIIWALLPNGMVYYFFGDNGHASWMDAIIELHQHQSICPSTEASSG